MDYFLFSLLQRQIPNLKMSLPAPLGPKDQATHLLFGIISTTGATTISIRNTITARSAVPIDATVEGVNTRTHNVIRIRIHIQTAGRTQTKTNTDRPLTLYQDIPHQL